MPDYDLVLFLSVKNSSGYKGKSVLSDFILFAEKLAFSQRKSSFSGLFRLMKLLDIPVQSLGSEQDNPGVTFNLFAEKLAFCPRNASFLSFV